MEVGSISEIRPNSGGPGLDVYAARRRTGEKVPELAGDQILDVRSFVTADGPFGNEIAGEEFAGARCTVKARDYSAQVTTPARLRVPIYRLELSALSVACERDAFEPRSLVLEVYNKTKAERYAASANGGLAGLVVMTAINELSDETKHEFAYPPVRSHNEPHGRRQRRCRKRASPSRLGVGCSHAQHPLAPEAGAWHPVHPQELEPVERSRES